MNKILIDTNIFVYALNADSDHNLKCIKILEKESNLFTTHKNISEFFAVCSKLKIQPKEVWDFYLSLKTNISIIYPDGDSLQYFETLYKKYNPVGNRVFDLEIVSVMLAHEIVNLATVNTKDFIEISEIQLIEGF